MTSFVHKVFGRGTRYQVQSLQMELKPQVRVAQRFPTASLYERDGLYDADPHCVAFTRLVNFIEYLKTTV